MLPKRVPQHISETTSYKIFSNSIPDNWIIRGVTERDYGIDFYLELVNNKNELTGDLILIQLKSKKEIKWNKEGHYYLSNTKFSTSHYWYRFPIPVFVFLVDLKTKECFYTPVKHDIRLQFDKFLNKDPVKYTFIKSISKIDKTFELSLVVFQVVYYIEKHRERVENEILYFLSNLEKITDFLDDHMRRDFHLGIETQDLITIEAIYQNFDFLCYSLQIKWDIPKLNDIKRESIQKFGKYYELYEHDLGKLVMKLRPLVPILIKRMKEVFDHEKAYWLYKNRTMFNYVINLEDYNNYA